MKHLFFFVFLLILVPACGEKTALTPGEQFNETGFEIVDLGGDLSKAVRKDRHGSIVEEGYLKNKRKNGAWMTYQEGGRLESVSSWIDGKRYGMEVKMNKLLYVVEVSNYENDLRNGFSGKYKNTRPREESFYKDGQYHGLVKTYFDSGREQGKLYKTIEFENGVIHGKYRTYNPEGKMTLEYEYNNGERIGGGMVQ